ncbi:UI-like [Denticeps clupeoides]|uniref:Corticotropin-releasing factor domain-containing protein n=1 Tax=Denticeps clupeoides TaxID=299321 RepID=A0A8C4C4N8_9TELE|nr:urocortin [Denticeps clupeoides]XP_028822451.1 UI-like [Denticeps clupeoides]
MKPVPSVLLLATVLLSPHTHPAACRPLSLLDGHGYTSQLDEVLLRAGDSAASYLLGEKVLRHLQRGPGAAAPEVAKRNDDPPISIDLTFHLLRNMIEMARIENQREQAELNRKYLDEVGK